MKTSVVLCFLSIFLLQSVFGQDTSHKIQFPFYPLFYPNVKVNISYFITGVDDRQIDTNGSRCLIQSRIKGKKATIKSEKIKEASEKINIYRKVLNAVWADDENTAIPEVFNTEIETYLSGIPILVEKEMKNVYSIKIGIDKKGELYLIHINNLKPSIAIQFWIESWHLSSSKLLKNTQININLTT